MKQYDILFICSANVGRSQMAEGYYNKLTNGKHAISAGIHDFSEKYKGKPAPEIIETMLEENVNLEQHTVKQLEEGMLEKAEKVVVLCDKKECPEFLKKSKNVTFISVHDPYQKSKNEISNIRDSIKTIVERLINSNESKV